MKKTDTSGHNTGLLLNRLMRLFAPGRSVLPLVAANLVAIVCAVIERWDLMTLLWIYWVQNIIIGFFQFIRILVLKDYSTDGFKVNNRPVEPTAGTKYVTAIFFLFHYGIFHLIYAQFLLFAFGPPATNPALDVAYAPAGMLLIALSIGAFIIDNLVAFFVKRKRDREKKPNLGVLMFFPYARIIPMHLTIILGGALLMGFGANGSLPAIVLFLLLKTLADILMQGVENRIRARKK